MLKFFADRRTDGQTDGTKPIYPGFIDAGAEKYVYHWTKKIIIV